MSRDLLRIFIEGKGRGNSSEVLEIDCLSLFLIKKFFSSFIYFKALDEIVRFLTGDSSCDFL